MGEAEGLSKKNKIPINSTYSATPINSSNIGFQLLKKHGWKEGTGLGISGQGRLEPLQAYWKKSKRGVGADKVQKTLHNSEKIRNLTSEVKTDKRQGNGGQYFQGNQGNYGQHNRQWNGHGGQCDQGFQGQRQQGEQPQLWYRPPQPQLGHHPLVPQIGVPPVGVVAPTYDQGHRGQQNQGNGSQYFQGNQGSYGHQNCQWNEHGGQCNQGFQGQRQQGEQPQLGYRPPQPQLGYRQPVPQFGVPPVGVAFPAYDQVQSGQQNQRQGNGGQYFQGNQGNYGQQNYQWKGHRGQCNQGFQGQRQQGEQPQLGYRPPQPQLGYRPPVPQTRVQPVGVVIPTNKMCYNCHLPGCVMRECPNPQNNQLARPYDQGQRGQQNQIQGNGGQCFQGSQGNYGQQIRQWNGQGGQCNQGFQGQRQQGEQPQLGYLPLQPQLGYRPLVPQIGVPPVGVVVPINKMCYNCRLPGCIARECPNPQNNQLARPYDQGHGGQQNQIQGNGGQYFQGNQGNNGQQNCQWNEQGGQCNQGFQGQQLQLGYRPPQPQLGYRPLVPQIGVPPVGVVVPVNKMCYNCRLPEYIARECPNPQNSQPGQADPARAFAVMLGNENVQVAF